MQSTLFKILTKSEVRTFESKNGTGKAATLKLQSLDGDTIIAETTNLAEEMCPGQTIACGIYFKTETWQEREYQKAVVMRPAIIQTIIIA